jgi:hypothetical protein
MQELAVAAHQQLVDRSERQIPAGRLRLEARVLGDVGDQVGEVDHFDRRLGRAAFQPGERERLADQLVQAVSPHARSARASLELVGILARESDRRLQPRERRAQLVGHVVQQAPLRCHEALKLLRHAVEVVAEIGDLVAAALHERPRRVCRGAPRRRRRKPSAGRGSAWPGTTRAAR